MILWRLYQRRLEEAIEQAKIEARTEGMAEGRAEGIAEGRTEGRTEGRAEGIVKNYQLWEAWNNRRLEAEAQNLPFNEPPPSPPQVDANPQAARE